MFTWEDGSNAIINKAADRYLAHFGEDPPFYIIIYQIEYTEENPQYDITVGFAQAYAAYLDECIKNNYRIPKPDNYDDICWD